MGQAIRDYYFQGKNTSLTVYSDIAEVETWETAYFFRSLAQMPEIEKTAIQLGRGKVLDIGAGAGCHLQPLADNGCRPFALETDEGAIEVLRHSGKAEAVYYANYFEFQPPYLFDTLFLMMNGIGICESLDGLRTFLDKAHAMISNEGQILLDSYDLTYLLGEEAIETRMAEQDQYFGQVRYELANQEVLGEPFKWLFIDPETLGHLAASKGWEVTLPAFEEGHFLARLTPPE